MDQNLLESIESLKNNFNDLLNTGSYYVTEEIADEIKAILNGIEKIKLDYLFMVTSKNRAKDLNLDKLYNEQIVSIALMRQGGSMLREIKTDLNKALAIRTDENELRRSHFNARVKLRAFLESLNPFTYGAHARLENFSHNVGASDRFITYRSHMTQHHYRDPLKNWSIWNDQKSWPNASILTPDRNNSNRRPKTVSTFANSNDNESLVQSDNNIMMIPTRYTLTLQESNDNLDKVLIANGMIPHFPDKSETKYSFANTKPSNPAPFTINPTPNMNIFDRPFKSASVDSRNTEYQLRYTNPDESKIDRFPWVKRL